MQIIFPIPTSPTGVAYVSNTGGGSLVGNNVIWNLGSLSAGESGTVTVTVSFSQDNTWSFQATNTWKVGLTSFASSSSVVDTTHYTIALLRYGSITSCNPQSPPNSSIFVASYPVQPALDRARDMEKPNFNSGNSFPHETSDLNAAAACLIYYQLDGNNGNTLRATKSSGKIVIHLLVPSARGPERIHNNPQHRGGQPER